mmetsp:Transcript_15419/g.30317  ORF Transcript_15419/g.30317 Transcript_15419/m.30317 type:complete len:128 (-) Transcript_15419:100-483(-)|eukprot:CAMPEP_0175150214 /NCGR_PEP_ID=MMETSP0087-20121206/17735_1 /TAXON_ID=136419 /ORGANISM="Unknown Unknown, Strain D1" /LENGTH=127 /DNA_ID=CAMNT_0016436113 /DNA_START=24 /DNA_END=407 /DNA_ORIENTATION=+
MSLSVLKNVDFKDSKNLEDWGFRAGAGEGECAVNGKFLSKENGNMSGIWQCTPGGFDVPNRANTENIFILSGKVKLINMDSKEVTELATGDTATLELGSSIRWEIVETVTKFFVISPPPVATEEKKE